MKRIKYQPFPEFIKVITYIKSPDVSRFFSIIYGKHVELVSISDFIEHESNPFKVDYCTILEDTKQIAISSKAKYNEVIIYGYGEGAIDDILLKQQKSKYYGYN